MAKRFTSTDIWGEDWFLEMPNEYKLFWYYMLANCDHAGLFKVNLRSFSGLLEVKVAPTETLKLFNNGKQRVREISKSIWLIEDFFFYQYGHKFNRNNKVHASVEQLYLKHGVSLTSIRGLTRGLDEDTQRVKDKDKDKDILSRIIETSNEFSIIRGDENFLNLALMVVLQMMDVFTKKNPGYLVQKIEDYHACLNIAYRIAEMNQWNSQEVLNGKLDDTIAYWKELVDFISKDNWLNTKTLTDICSPKIWQKVVNGLAAAKKGNNPEKKMVI